MFPSISPIYCRFWQRHDWGAIKEKCGWDWIMPKKSSFITFESDKTFSQCLWTKIWPNFLKEWIALFQETQDCLHKHTESQILKHKEDRHKLCTKSHNNNQITTQHHRNCIWCCVYVLHAWIYSSFHEIYTSVWGNVFQLLNHLLLYTSAPTKETTSKKTELSL